MQNIIICVFRILGHGVSDSYVTEKYKKTLTKIFLQLDSKWRQSLQEDESVLLSPQAQLEGNKHPIKQYNVETNNNSTCVPSMVLNGGLQRKVVLPNILIKSNKKTLAVIWWIILMYLLHSLDTNFSPDRLYRRRSMQKYPFLVFLTQLCRILHSHEHWLLRNGTFSTANVIKKCRKVWKFRPKEIPASADWLLWHGAEILKYNYTTSGVCEGS